VDKTFSSGERLKKQKEFDNVFKTGKLISGKYCIIYHKPEKERKLGIIVSKKVSKKAVERNHIKRWFREIYRNNKDELPKGVHLIIISKPTAIKGSFNEVCKDVLRAFSKINY
jgi:ribonuclease P protein component